LKLFKLSKDEATATAPARSNDTGTVPATNNDEIKSENIKKLTGVASLDELTNKAPTSDTETETTGRGRGRPAKRPSVADEQRAKDTQKALELEAKKARAREIVGRRLLKNVSEMPYDTWAFFLQDGALRLNEEEAQELSDIYIELASAYDADFSSPLWLVPTILSTHYDFVMKRYAYLNKKQAALKAKQKGGKVEEIPPLARMGEAISGLDS
jgi:hypothetical protein